MDEYMWKFGRHKVNLDFVLFKGKKNSCCEKPWGRGGLGYTNLSSIIHTTLFIYMNLDGTILIPYVYIVSEILIEYLFFHSRGTIHVTLSLLLKTTTSPKTSQLWECETTSNMPHLFIMLHIRLMTITNRQIHGPTNVGAFNHCLHHGMLYYLTCHACTKIARYASTWFLYWGNHIPYVLYPLSTWL